MLVLVSLLPFIAALASFLVAAASILRRRQRSHASWAFFAGMVMLATDSALTGFGLHAIGLADALRWLTASMVAKSLLPAVWVYFSLTYSRGNQRAAWSRWRMPLLLLVVLPLALTIAFQNDLVHVLPAESPGLGVRIQTAGAAKLLNAFLLVGFVFVLMNLEQTFRSAVGTARWQIKFVVLGLALIFGARIYVRSQVILFSIPDIALWGFESGALLVGCLFLAIAYVRTGFAEIDVYPSLAVVRSSLTVLMVGGYLVAVGIVAQFVKQFGGAEIFQFQAFVVLLGMAGLALLLLSDRARQRLHQFAVRHFSKAQHDSVRIWTLFSQRLARVEDESDLCDVSVKLLSETFDVLSVTAWLLDDEQEHFVLRASTGRQSRSVEAHGNDEALRGSAVALDSYDTPFDVEEVGTAWGEAFRQANPNSFPEGGHRWCIPLRAGGRTLGALVLADRVSGAVYTVEEVELLKCIGDQISSVLINLRLANEVARSRELEAFRTMSAFFVHDLKNAAASLNLMLKNLPVHFNDPAFREDALRAVGNTARRIDEMINRLSAFRNDRSVTRTPADLNRIVNDTLDRLPELPNVTLTKDLQPVPQIMADPAQLQSVVTNLVLNARDALPSDGCIQVRTGVRDRRVVLSVADNGCGMSPQFVRESLFRPFQSTKKQGLGIGLFQSRAVVQAHGGTISVETEEGRGTTFQVSLPVAES